MAPTLVQLTGPKKRVTLEVADQPLDWSIDAAPSLTIACLDPGRKLDLSPGYLGATETDLIARLWGRNWAVAETSRDELTVGLTLAHRGVAGMRAYTGKLMASDEVGRPPFASQIYKASRASRPNDPLFCPLVNPEASGYKPPVLKAQSTRADTEALKQRDEQLAPGFKSGASFKVKGQEADDEQKRVLASALSVADDVKAPRNATLALICALIIESACRNLTYGDRDSTGPLQVRAGTARGLGINPRDVEAVCRAFLTKGYFRYGSAISQARKTPSKQPGNIAQDTQGSAFPERYQTVLPEARKILEAWTGGGSASGAGDDDQGFAIGDDEDGWTAFTRLATESNRRAYATLDALYWVTDNQVATSRPVARIRRRGPGVKSIGTISLDSFRRVDTLPCELIVDDLRAWQLAGHAVMVEGEGEAVDGVWIVGKWGRASRRDVHASFELTRPRPVLSESQISSASGRSGQQQSSANAMGARDGYTGPLTTRGGAKGIVTQAYAIARAAGGESIYVGSDFRSGSITSSGKVSDHSSNDASRAARDIGKRGVDLVVGPPAAELDAGAAAIGKAFGRNYGSGNRTIIDSFNWKGYRIQIIWRTPLYGGHMGHIHCGARKA